MCERVRTGAGVGELDGGVGGLARRGGRGARSYIDCMVVSCPCFCRMKDFCDACGSRLLLQAYTIFENVFIFIVEVCSIFEDVLTFI